MDHERKSWISVREAWVEFAFARHIGKVANSMRRKSIDVVIRRHSLIDRVVELDTFFRCDAVSYFIAEPVVGQSHP